ncbi:hypothetical protein Tco_0196539 [Tanacetum coccineum]
MQDKNIAISELKKLIEMFKRKGVDTNFEQPSILGKPPVQSIRNQTSGKDNQLHKSETISMSTTPVCLLHHSAVSYTSVTLIPSSRVFWGADEEPVAPPSPNYIRGPEDPQTPPVPQDEDELSELGSSITSYFDSPTAESPGYGAKSDPEEYEDDETEDGPVDYPMDRGENVDDDDDDSSRDDIDDKDEDEEDKDEEDEEEEHLALADSAVVVPTASISLPPEAEVERLLAMPTSPPSPPISLSPPSAGELARCTAPSAHSSQPPVPSPLLPSLPVVHTKSRHSGCLQLGPYVMRVTAALPSPPLPPLPPSLYIPPPVDRRDDIPESERPPRKRSCLFALGSRYEVRENSTARPTRGRGVDYGFVSILDAKERQRGIREVGYGIRDTWVDPAEAVPKIAPMTVGEVNTSGTEIAESMCMLSYELHMLLLEDDQDNSNAHQIVQASNSPEKNMLKNVNIKLQPLPPVDSPTAESPGYVAESDPEEDPEEYEDDETEDGPIDYPMDGGEDRNDDDGGSHRDDADDEDEDEEDKDEEEEEEHLAPADSAIVASISLPPEADVERLLAMPTLPPSPPISLSPPSAGERLARCTAPSAHSSPPPVPSPLLPSSGCLTQIQTLRIASTYALVDAVTAALPSPPLPLLPPSLYIPPLVDCRDDIPESERPPRKRSCLFALGPRYKVGESSTARPTRGRGVDYGFVSTLDFEERRRGIREVGYGIRDTWVDPAEAVPELAPMTVGEVNTRVTHLAKLHEHDTYDLYALLEDAQDSRTRISQRVTMDS